jgi:hypothetical protein
MRIHDAVAGGAGVVDLDLDTTSTTLMRYPDPG